MKLIRTMRDKNVPISVPFIIEKALKFAKTLGYDEFRGNNEWPEKEENLFIYILRNCGKCNSWLK